MFWVGRPAKGFGIEGLVAFLSDTVSRSEVMAPGAGKAPRFPLELHV